MRYVVTSKAAREGGFVLKELDDVTKKTRDETYCDTSIEGHECLEAGRIKRRARLFRLIIEPLGEVEQFLLLHRVYVS